MANTRTTRTTGTLATRSPTAKKQVLLNTSTTPTTLATPVCPAPRHSGFAQGSAIRIAIWPEELPLGNQQSDIGAVPYAADIAGLLRWYQSAHRECA